VIEGRKESQKRGIAYTHTSIVTHSITHNRERERERERVEKRK
jgi:hypothetical protein